VEVSVTKRVAKRILHVLLLVVLSAALGCHLWAEWHYRAAQKALSRRAPAEAQEHLAQCLKVWFWSPQTYLLAARTARRAGAFDAADGYLRDCRALGGSADAIDLEQKLLRAHRGQLSAVEADLVGRLRQDHPDSGLILEVLIPLYLRNYQLYNAQECVQRWVACEPDRVEAWLRRAQVFEYFRNNDEVMASFRRVVELDPDNDDARLKLAGMLTDAHPLEALEHFEILRPRLGDTPAVLGGLACCRRLLNQPDEARRLLEQLLAQDPRNGRALGERGRLAMQVESAAKAEPWFRQALDEMPREIDLHYGLYKCLEGQGKHAEASEVLVKLKRLEADLDRLRDVTRQIAEHPHDPDLRFEAGVIQIRNGLEVEGVRWLESALREDPSHAASHRALADYYERSNDRERAARHRQLAQGFSEPGRERGQAP
jgi:Tfp pilus assembly protein PilF